MLKAQDKKMTDKRNRNNDREKEKKKRKRLKIRVGTRNAEKRDRNNSKRGREERLAWGLGGTVRREARKKPQHNNRGMRDRGARGAAQIKWEPNVTVTKVPRYRQWKHLNREMFFCMCVCTCVYFHILKKILSLRQETLPPCSPHPPAPPPPPQPRTAQSQKQRQGTLNVTLDFNYYFFFFSFPFSIFKQAPPWRLPLLKIHF